MTSKLKQMKKEALDQFEASLEKKDNETNYSLYSSQILKNLIENAKITIEGMEIVFVYQVIMNNIADKTKEDVIIFCK